TGLNARLKRSLREAQMPSGIPISKAMMVDTITKDKVCMVWRHRSMPRISRKAATVKRLNFLPAAFQAIKAKTMIVITGGTRPNAASKEVTIQKMTADKTSQKGAKA